MKVVDLNLLIYAVNEDGPRHAQARAWLESALNSDEPLGLAWIVLLGFLRLTTRPGLFPRPLPVAEAVQAVDEWFEFPNVVTLHPGRRHWKLLRELLHRTGAGGNLTSDAHLAAMTIECGGVLYSTDADFGRFSPQLRCVNPLVG